LKNTPSTTILLVENDPAALESDSIALESFDYAVIAVVGLEKAVELAASAQELDLVLMEIDRASVQTAAQAARAILAHREIPILPFATVLPPEMVAMIREIPGCYGFVAKSSEKFALQISIEMALQLFADRQVRHLNAPVVPDSAEQALEENQERFHQILSALHEVIWLRDVKTRQVLYVNPAFESLCGLSCADFYRDPDAFINIIHPDDKKWIAKGSLYRSDIHRIVRPDGSIRWVWGRTFPVINAQGEAYRTVAINEDITERKLTEEELKLANEKLIAQMKEIQLLQSNLRDQVIRDPLTGLYNRRYLSETLDRELDRALREDYPVSLVMIDIDDFKQVNDTYGHFAGDVVLKHLALLLTHQTRASDLVCRLGGDEFLLVFPNLNATTAFERADQCRRSFQETTAQFDGEEIRTTISIGIATFPEHGATSQAVLTSADRAMYAAKDNGRNCVIGS
jgi:diguanylate cyclase (GGDEF)-like protein/PAS domain S-box-containing protein